MEAAVILLRWVQYATGFVLMGGALFVVYALPTSGPSSAAELGWPRRLLAGMAALLVLASLAGLVLQTAVVAGSLSAALEPSVLLSVLSEMAMGSASLVRAFAAAAALLVVLFSRPSRRAWLVAASFGGVTSASMAWMGHGAATEGAVGVVHLVADIVHLLAAGVWVGALAVFVGLALDSIHDPQHRESFHLALAGFSGVGSTIVAVLVASGLINSWFLVGIAGATALVRTPYGLILLAKLALFVLMATLAAANRFGLAPALRDALDQPEAGDGAVAALRRSLAFEFTVALLLLVAVAWLGRLSPITAQ